MRGLVSLSVAPNVYYGNSHLQKNDVSNDSIYETINWTVHAIFAMSAFLLIAYVCVRCVGRKWIPLKQTQNSLGLNPHIPNMEELQNSPVEKVHALWRLNNETLLGIIAKKEIPQFGFHGTDERGMKGIQESRKSSTSGDYIWVASYDYQLDPITALADFYTIAEKGGGYSHDGGGVFTICTNNDQRCRKYIYSHTPSAWYRENTPDKDLNTEAESQFFELIWRNNYNDNTQYTDRVKKLRWNGDDSLCSTKELFPAEEFHVKFNEYNYDETVKGILKTSDRAISIANMTQLYNLAQTAYEEGVKNEVNDSWKKYCIAKRLWAQELIFDAFKNLGVMTPEKLQRKWKKYQGLGAECMQKIGEITNISLKRFFHKKWGSNCEKIDPGVI